MQLALADSNFDFRVLQGGCWPPRGGAMGAFSTLKSYLVISVGLGPGVNTGQATYPGTPMGVR